MVYHTLVILLHRPFVETAASLDTNTVSLCWSRCEDAARGTTSLLERYRAAFSLARAPYLIVSDAKLPVTDSSVVRYIRRGDHPRAHRCSACKIIRSQSTLADLHRGFGREFGD